MSTAFFPTSESPVTVFDRIKQEIFGRGLDAPVEERTDEYPDDVSEFTNDVLGVQLWDKQLEIGYSVATHARTSVRSCHASGKSFSAARFVIWFLHRNPGSIVITTAPTARQVRHVLWRNIRSAASSAIRPLLGRALTQEYQIDPDWYALGFKGADENSDAAQGYHAEHILVVVDEAAGVAESLLVNLESILTGAGARLLMIGNPTSMSGMFRRSFHADQHLYNTITISAYDTPNFTTFGITREDMISGEWKEKLGDNPLPYPGLVDPRWVARQIDLHGIDSPYVQSRVDAEFPSDDESVLIALSQIDAADAEPQEPNPESQIYAGIDVALTGDETTICIKQGDVVLHEGAWRLPDLMESVGKAQNILDQFGGKSIQVRVDVIGMGQGFADRLRELGYKVTGVNVGSASSDKEQWANLRHELWWQLRERFREERIAPAPGVSFTDVTKAQLSDIQYKFQSNYTKPVIEPKAETKKRTGMSPDRAEAMMLAFGVLPRPKASPGMVKVGSAKGKW